MWLELMCELQEINFAFSPLYHSTLMCLCSATPAPDEDFSFAINTRRDGADFVADITFSGTVDRERRPHMFVTLQANEVLESDTSVVTSLGAIATLEIEILDINDNAPIFFNNAGNPDGDIPYVASVPESASLGHVVVDDAQAFDLDEASPCTVLLERLRVMHGSSAHVDNL